MFIIQNFCILYHVRTLNGMKSPETFNLNTLVQIRNNYFKLALVKLGKYPNCQQMRTFVQVILTYK